MLKYVQKGVQRLDDNYIVPLKKTTPFILLQNVVSVHIVIFVINH